MEKKVYYASVIGKLPRKRKEDRFEIKLDGDTQIEAREKLLALIKEHGIRNPRAAVMQLWGISESEFVDSNGEKQTMVFRNIFPSGSAIAIDLG